MSSAEFMLELTNMDFSRPGDEPGRLDKLVDAWNGSQEFKVLSSGIVRSERGGDGGFVMEQGLSRGYPRNLFMQSLILIHRMALVPPPPSSISLKFPFIGFLVPLLSTADSWASQ
jgi:hypothetical protein